MISTGLIVVKAGVIIAYGFFLGLGFYGSKKVTNYIDYRLLLRDKKYLELLANGE